MKGFPVVAIVLLASTCLGCDPISETRVEIDSPTARGMSCAVEALRRAGFDAEGFPEESHVPVQSGDIYMGLRVRRGGYELYVSKVGKPHTCGEIQKFSAHMRRASQVIVTQCSGSAPPKISVEIPAKNCSVRVDG